MRLGCGRIVVWNVLVILLVLGVVLCVVNIECRVVLVGIIVLFLEILVLLGFDVGGVEDD